MLVSALVLVAQVIIGFTQVLYVLELFLKLMYLFL